MVRQSVIRITDRKRRCAIFAVSEPKASPDLHPKTAEPIEKTNLFVKPNAEPNLFELCRGEKRNTNVNLFVKPSAIEFTRIAEAGKRRTKFNDTMKRIWMTTFLSLTLCASACGGRARANDNPPQEKTANPKVYLTRTITPEALVRIYEALGREATGRVAVKLSTGEPGGHHFLQPALVAPLVRKVGGTIVECNTAYGGGRARTADHLKAAADHGFTAIAAVDIMDAEGETALPVEGGRHLAEDYVGKNFLNYDFTVVLSHFKGHAMGGFGGAIKNISIGIASSAGKAWIHSAGKTKNAAEMWSALPPQDDFLESMAEAAKAVKLAAQGKAEQTTAFLQLEQLKEELAARAQVMQARTRRGTHLLGKGRMLRAYPKLKHGQNNRSLNSLLEQLEDEYPDSFNGFGIQ